tara:strand:- start:160 stop:492 length:333 start_codon:yes stop_codon:yes gene_type:complete
MVEAPDNLKCQCHLIDWRRGAGNYRLLSTGEKLTFSGSSGHCCQTKVNEDLMDMKYYKNVCQYIPGKNGSKFPVPVFNKMIADRLDVPVSSVEAIPHNRVISALSRSISY